MTALFQLTNLFQKILLLLLLSPFSICAPGTTFSCAGEHSMPSQTLRSSVHSLFSAEHLELAQIVEGAHVSSKCGLSISDGVRGIQALQDVEPNEVLVQLPFTSMIMARPWSLRSLPAGISRKYWAASSM